MDASSIHVLVVDDYEPWRAFVASVLHKRPELRIIAEATNGLEAVQIAQLLQPDLILLDIGLPKLNGLEAAPRIRKVSPRSKILFTSENRSADIVKVALSTGASGYIVKSNASTDLLPALKAVLEGKQFVSPSLTVPASSGSPNERIGPLRQTGEYHEVKLCPDDPSLVDEFAQFIEAALRIGNVVVVIASESLQTSILQRLRTLGVAVVAGAERDRPLFLDIYDPQSTSALYEAVKAQRREGRHVAVG